MSFTIPHTGLSYDPQRTDWDYLLPLELSDEELVDGSPASAAQSQRLAVITGFIALIKVFLCIVDLLDKSFPGPPPYFGLSSGRLATMIFKAWDGKDLPARALPDLPVLESLFQVMTRLDATLTDLPEPLSLRNPRNGSPRGQDEKACADMAQFEIMRANIHITAIYFQSLVLEMCLNKLQSIQSHTPVDDAPASSPVSTISSQLWQVKESVARELLDILSYSSALVLESNGSSMVGLISFDIDAYSLLLRLRRFGRLPRHFSNMHPMRLAILWWTMSSGAAVTTLPVSSKSWPTWTMYH